MQISRPGFAACISSTASRNDSDCNQLEQDSRRNPVFSYAVGDHAIHESLAVGNDAAPCRRCICGHGQSQMRNFLIEAGHEFKLASSLAW